MASDSEEEILDDADAICGWGAADFDAELVGRGHRKAPVKVATKRKPQKALANSKSVSGLDKEPLAQLSPVKQDRKTVKSPVRQAQAVEPPKERKVARKQREEAKEPHDTLSPKSLSRTFPLREEKNDIAALGRERRMRIVAAAMAANVPRKSSLGSVVSASFDADSDDEQGEEEAMRRRRTDDWTPSSAPENHQQLEKLPRVTEPSTAPAGPIEAVKMIHPPLPLPLLSIKPDCGGNETRLIGGNAPLSEAPRHWRRRRRKQPSLLPSRGASDQWESNFPPALRRSRSPRKYQADLPSSTASSFTRAVRVPLAPRQENPSVLSAKEHLPLIHRNSTEFEPAAEVLAGAGKFSACDDRVVQRDERDDGDDDDESWTRCYDDPEAVASSMAGLIQALSTFAGGGKHMKSSKVRKSKRRRVKQQLQQQQVPPTVVRCSPLGDTDVTSSRATMSSGQRGAEPSDRRRKHRSKQPNENSSKAEKDEES